MTGILAVLALAGLDGPDVAAYFPLTAGTRWTYEVSGLNASVDLAKSSIEIEGKQAVPVVTLREGKEIDPRYYRIEGDTVYLVAFEPLKPLPSAHPILRVNEKRSVWTYNGHTQMHGALVPFSFKAQSNQKGKRNYFGKDRACIEVVMDAEIEVLPGQVIKYKQTTLFAADVGWVETKTRQTVDRKSQETTIRLVRFEPAS